MGIEYTYNSMLASIQDWHVDSNTDFVAALPEIMNRGELMAQRYLDLAVFDDQLTASSVSANANVAKPTTMVRELSIYAVPSGGVRRALKKRSLDFVRLYAAATGTPIYYAELDSTNWAVAPTPDANITAEVHAIVRMPTLVDVGTSQKTWISTHYPDLLWHAIHYYACLYLKKWRLAAEALEEYKRILPQARAESANQRRHDPEDMHSNRVHQNAPTPAAPAVET